MFSNLFSKIMPLQDNIEKYVGTRNDAENMAPARSILVKPRRARIRMARAHTQK